MNSFNKNSKTVYIDMAVRAVYNTNFPNAGRLKFEVKAFFPKSLLFWDKNRETRDRFKVKTFFIYLVVTLKMGQNFSHI